MLRRTMLLACSFAVLAFASPAFPGEFSQVADAIDRFAKSGRPVTITAERLHTLLADGDASNDPLLISVCAPEDFAKDGLPGSINIPRGAFWKAAQLAKLPAKSVPIVTYCYTGTGAVGPAVVLNLMGYQAVQLEWGLMGWNRSDAGMGPAPRFPATQKDYPVVRQSAATLASHALPEIATGKADLAAILVARGDAVEAADKSVSMTAEQVHTLLSDADVTNDPFLLDIRSAEAFARGHVRSSVNIPASRVYEPDSLARLPVGRRIVIIDERGQTAVGTSYLLSILGYNARGLQYGMMGWSRDDALIAPSKRFPADQRDFATRAAR